MDNKKQIIYQINLFTDSNKMIDFASKIFLLSNIMITQNLLPNYCVGFFRQSGKSVVLFYFFIFKPAPYLDHNDHIFLEIKLLSEHLLIHIVHCRQLLKLSLSKQLNADAVQLLWKEKKQLTNLETKTNLISANVLLNIRRLVQQWRESVSELSLFQLRQWSDIIR